MARRVDPAQSMWKNYLPACVKCKHYRPNALFDPFDTETQCAFFGGDIPAEFLLMDAACGELRVEEGKEFIDVGKRQYTAIERWATEHIYLEDQEVQSYMPYDEWRKENAWLYKDNWERNLSDDELKELTEIGWEMNLERRQGLD